MDMIKEKAEQLIEQFQFVENEYKEHLTYAQAKQCAIIAVDEVLSNEDNLYNVKRFYQAVREELSK